MFENGLGVDRNMEKALGLYRLAAEDGHPQAKERVVLLEGQGFKPPDPEKPLIVAIERPPEPPAPTVVDPASTTETPVQKDEKPKDTAIAAAPTALGQEVEPTPDPEKAPPVPAKAPEPAASAESSDKPPLQKKGFYAALKSLKSEKPEADPANGPAAEPEVKTKASLPETKPAPAPEPEEPTEKPLVIAKADPPVSSSESTLSSSSNGLNLKEKLEMADLAYTLKEYQQALSIWAVLAQDGNAEAQYKLGSMFNNGEAVPVDRVRAYYWWEKARENGYAEASTALADLEKSLTHMEKRQIQRTN